MKKIITIVAFAFTLHTAVAQDDQPGMKLREKMVEYIQTKLGLEKAEAERFQPVFLDYIKELRRTNKEFRGDRLVLQQKVVELRLRYREQFKPIIGEKRSNEVFQHEGNFLRTLRQEVQERRQERIERRADKKNTDKLLEN